MGDELQSLAERSPFWRSKRTALLIGAFLLALVLAVGGWLALRPRSTSPADVIAAMASSAVKGDADSVVGSIDTTSLVDSAVDEVLSDPNERTAVISDYLKSHPNASGDEIKTKVRKTLDEAIREHVKSGTLQSRIPIGSSSLKALVAQAAARGSIRSMKSDGDIAHVVVLVPYNHRTLTVQVLMRRSGDTWKIDRVENLAAVLKQAGQ